MSTFNGIVKEFPDIRIDYFRPDRDPAAHPPLAYFLSHVHSDHLIGLETCKSPFIYCSPATRDILLKLEKYPHRMNFAKGILETRKQTYKHLKKLLKAIPLDTPTKIELAPGREIRVTLLDANHCVGAVMFLIEDDYKSVLYTGDIRSERWWVDSLKRHPVLLPYVHSPVWGLCKKLDCIYLDTTFVVGGVEDRFRQFPSKADGIQELIHKVLQYQEHTVFYIDAWTFGYEDVWQALSVLLDSQIHVDEYRHGMYNALANGAEPRAPEAVKLMGFQFGNHQQQGCLSLQQCRLHSCEQGTGCMVWDQDFVRITPIISRHNGRDIAELGAGGGQGDLSVQHQLEVYDASMVCQLMELCASKLQGKKEILTGVLGFLTSATKGGASSLSLDDFEPLFAARASQQSGDCCNETDDVPLDKLVPLLAKLAEKSRGKDSGQTSNDQGSDATQAVPFTAKHSSPASMPLPTQITFPYSRHSSYEELCMLIEAFIPLDIYPCTVDETNWSTASSMMTLFGHLYRDPPFTFRHDESMKTKRRYFMPVDEDLHRQVSSSSNFMISDDTTINTDSLETHRRKEAIASNAALNQSKRTLERGTPTTRAERLDQDALGDTPWFSAMSQLHEGAIQCSESVTRPSSGLGDNEDEGFQKREHVLTTTRLDSSSPSPVARSPRNSVYALPSALEQLQQKTRKRERYSVGEQLEGYIRRTPVRPPDVVPGSSQPTLVPRKRVKLDPMAFRNEAADAALGLNGLQWGIDVQLVSVRGHQEREVEL